MPTPPMSVDVAIVGGGPSGLALGLSLARYEIRSVILEKEEDITQDPRGVVLTGDALRSLWTLGLGKYITSIGQELNSLNFHTTSFQNNPFFVVKVESDILEHALPSTVLQSQPKLEYFLRKLISSSKYCTLKSACEVKGSEEHAHGVIVHYVDRDREPQQIQARWLVGADGKRGIVRKRFLEVSAGIRQEVGIFEYEGTWIAANLRITLPTPESHPDLAFWDAGLDPESVYDLFWPRDWHFCRPPGRPVACGRFGPNTDRLWRHEFAVPEWDDDSMDATSMFWDHLVPLITRTIQSRSGAKAVELTFPRDCIEILRCRPFHFSHRVVNKWFANRTMLIGDAAHVFPPFGGQGVACGVQDAVGLAWRLAVLTKVDSLSSSVSRTEALLQAWADERRIGIDNSALLTKQNGELCNKKTTLLGSMLLTCVKIIQGFMLRIGLSDPLFARDSHGYRSCGTGTFLPGYGGGIKLSQIYVQARLPNSPTWRVELSDQILRRVSTTLTLLVIQRPEQNLDGLLRALLESGVNPCVLSEKSIVQFDLTVAPAMEIGMSRWLFCRAAPHDLLHGYPLRPGYNPQQFIRRLGNSRVQYVVVRPDNIVFAMAEDLHGLVGCLEELKMRFS